MNGSPPPVAPACRHGDQVLSSPPAGGAGAAVLGSEAIFCSQWLFPTSRKLTRRHATPEVSRVCHCQAASGDWILPRRQGRAPASFSPAESMVIPRPSAPRGSLKQMEAVRGEILQPPPVKLSIVKPKPRVPAAFLISLLRRVFPVDLRIRRVGSLLGESVP